MRRSTKQKSPATSSGTADPPKLPTLGDWTEFDEKFFPGLSEERKALQQAAFLQGAQTSLAPLRDTSERLHCLAEVSWRLTFEMYIAGYRPGGHALPRVQTCCQEFYKARQKVIRKNGSLVLTGHLLVDGLLRNDRVQHLLKNPSSGALFDPMEAGPEAIGRFAIGVEAISRMSKEAASYYENLARKYRRGSRGALPDIGLLALLDWAEQREIGPSQLAHMLAGAIGAPPKNGTWYDAADATRQALAEGGAEEPQAHRVEDEGEWLSRITATKHRWLSRR